MAKKIFVLQERYYEYNDETYDASDGGNAVRAYTTLQAAKDAAVKLTIKELRDGGSQYFYEKYDVFDDSALEVLQKYDLEPKSNFIRYDEAQEINAAIQHGNFSEDELIIIAKGIEEHCSLFFVQEVEIHE